MQLKDLLLLVILGEKALPLISYWIVSEVETYRDPYRPLSAMHTQSHVRNPLPSGHCPTPRQPGVRSCSSHAAGYRQSESACLSQGYTITL
jgi:hypothetical protein